MWKLKTHVCALCLRAGNGTCGFAGDFAPAPLAMLCNPTYLAYRDDGSLFITDTTNNRIRMMNISQPGSAIWVSPSRMVVMTCVLCLSIHGLSAKCSAEGPRKQWVPKLFGMCLCALVFLCCYVLQTVVGDGSAANREGLGGLLAGVAAPLGITTAFTPLPSILFTQR